MKKSQDGSRKGSDSTDVVAPYARIRIIVFLICLVIAIVLLAWEAF